MNLSLHFTLAELTITDHREFDNTPDEKSLENLKRLASFLEEVKAIGMTPDEVVRRIVASDLKYDQVIREFDAWTHISIPTLEYNNPRKQALIIDRSGTRSFA